MNQWEIEYKIPIKISKPKLIGGFGAPIIFRFVFSAFKKSLVFGVIILLIASQASLFSAFEAHVISVTATIKDRVRETPPPDPSVCPFKTEPGKTVINFSRFMRSDKGQSEATVGPVFGYIPAGNYDITLASYDDHVHKPGQIQPQEQWYLILKDGDGNLIAETSVISDLPDDQNQIIEKVETGFTLSNDVFFATAFHDAYPINNPNSILPLCAVFEGEGGGSEFTLPSSLMPPPAGRVEDGLLALYTFEEENGRVVKDVSGVGEPLHLWIADESATSKVFGGLLIASSTIISDFMLPMKIINGVKATEAITIEAWVKPENITQGGPARIATLSKDPDYRNFTLSQARIKYDTRLRTTTTSNNGIPSISTPEGTATTSLTHVVYTRDSSGIAKMYIDGVEKISATVGGSVSNWDITFRFGLANEFTMDRPWLGEMHLIAVYNKALSASEVEQNFSAGADMIVVINEFLPNPTGNDDSLMPGGEWVELYNNSQADIDVGGWYLYDSLDSHPVQITAFNSDNNGNTTDSGETIVPGNGWLVVYLNGAYSSGWLNNSGGDNVRLYNGLIESGDLIDSHTYLTDAAENKSFARIPDGIGIWFDPIPTPGGPNILELENSDSVEISLASITIMEETEIIKEENEAKNNDELIEIDNFESEEDLINNIIEEISEEAIENEQEILLVDEVVNQDSLGGEDVKEEEDFKEEDAKEIEEIIQEENILIVSEE